MTFKWDFMGSATRLTTFIPLSWSPHGVHDLDLGWGYVYVCVCVYVCMCVCMDGYTSIIDSSVNLDPWFEDRDHYDHVIGEFIGF